MKKILNYFVRRVDFIVLLSDDENKLLCLVLSAYWLVHVNASVKWNTTRVSFCFLFVFFLFFFFCSFVSLGLPPSSPYHPSGSSQCTSPKHPVSCIEPGLVIRFIYDSIHISMPFSEIIPPSPSPTESKRLFYTSVSLLLSRIYFILCISP